MTEQQLELIGNIYNCDPSAIDDSFGIEDHIIHCQHFVDTSREYLQINDSNSEGYEEARKKYNNQMDWLAKLKQTTKNT